MTVLYAPLIPQVHTDTATCWWPILKAGSRTLSTWLPFDNPHGDLVRQRWHHIVVTRDPVTRYISGLAQMHRNAPTTVDRDDWPRLRPWLLDPVVEMPWLEFVGEVAAWSEKHGQVWTKHYNTHFSDQYTVTRVVPDGEPVTLFRLEDLEDLVEWLDRRGVELSDPPRLNASDQDLDAARELLDLDMIRERYAMDYEWIGRG